MHGGAAGSGGPSGKANGRYRHGTRTRDAIARRREMSGLLAQLRATLDEIG
jgi:hypothetical protein